MTLSSLTVAVRGRHRHRRHLPYRHHRMGALSSKKKEHIKWSWSGSPGHHSPYPIDEVPYPGSDLLYCFIDILASYRIMRNTVNLGPQAVTTNIEMFKQEFMDCYSEGFLLDAFVKVPGVKTTTRGQDWGDKQPCQAIFSKTPHRKPSNMEKTWDIKIEKSILSTKTLHTAADGHDSDLSLTIEKNAKTGARLVCAQPIGYVKSSSANRQYEVMGVELFFNCPQHDHHPTYTYHILHKPTRYTVVPDATQSLQQVECDADWMGQMKVFLEKGWKLVDICLDTQALADAFGMKSSSRHIDSIWLFEKEEKHIDDETARYEGVILEYIHKVKMNALGEETPCRDWRPVIAGMGLSGWELATIVQTPIFVQSSFTTYAIKLLMFFQRKIIPEHQKMLKNYRRTQAIKKSRKVQLDDFSKTLPSRFEKEQLGKDKKREGYYNHTLKRFVYHDSESLGDIPEDAEDEEEEEEVDLPPMGIFEDVGRIQAIAARGRRGAALEVPNGYIPGQGPPPPNNDLEQPPVGRRKR